MIVAGMMVAMAYNDWWQWAMMLGLTMTSGWVIVVYTHFAIVKNSILSNLMPRGKTIISYNCKKKKKVN
jgi:hypothetical protein